MLFERHGFFDLSLMSKPLHDFNQHMYISLKNRYAFHTVGKAANSTVKHFFYKKELIGTKFKEPSVHDRMSSPLLSPYQLSEEQLSGVLGGEGFFKFTFVRNPYSRLISCYLDRIVPCTSLPYRQLINFAGKQTGYKFSFREFVELICEQTIFQQNNHWRVQYYDTCCDMIKYDYIGKQESFALDMEKIWSRIFPDDNSCPMFAAQNKSPSITNSSQRISEFWESDLLALVNKMYEADFDYFGYDKRY